MITQQSKIDDLDDRELGGRRRAGATAGSLLVATALGIGIGLLAAPQAGVKTRKLLRKRIAELGESLGEGLEEAQEVSGRARRELRDRAGRMRKHAEGGLDDLRERWDELVEEEEDDSGPLGTILAVAAGIAATFFLTSDRAGPARKRVRDAAVNLRDRASDRWDRFQQERRSNGQTGTTSRESRAESGTGTSSEPIQPS
jgi:gas vesicle protein